MITFRTPSRFDLWWIAEHMAPIDRLECAAFGLSPIRALNQAYETSILLWVGNVEGMPEAVFGVVPVNLSTGWGRPWFLGTERARSNARAFLEIAPQYLERISAIFPRLDNYVHQDNGAAIRWLRRMGFVVETTPEHFGGQPMLHFYSGNF
jgi:hypothetical protein